MNWKARQMFSDREHGIVSGLSPISMVGGGNVPYPSYEDGGDVLPQLSNNYHTHPELHSHGSQRLPGSPLRPEDIVLFGQEGMQGGGTVPAQEPSIEQQVADLAAKMGISPVEARAMILRRMIQAKGVTLSDEVINQFATGLITLHEALAQAMGPPKMQVGGIVPLDLFEEGDQDINEALNMMSGSVSPSLSDIGPTETVEETVTVTEDQGPTDTSAIKRAYQELAMQAVGEAKDAIAQGAPVEQIQQPLKERLLMIDEEYRRKSGTEDTIFTEEFLVQIGPLMGETTGPVTMQDGGTVPEIMDPGMMTLEDQKNVMLNKKQALIKRRRYFEELSKTALSQRERDKAAQAVKSLDKQIRQIDEEIKGIIPGGAPFEPTIRDMLRASQFGKDVPEEVVAGKSGAIVLAGEKEGEKLKALKEGLPVKLPEEDELSTRSFWEDMKKTAMKARSGALLGGKTKQSGLSGLLDVLGQADVAEAESVGKAEQAMLSQLGESERTAALLGKPVSLTKEERDLDKGSILLLSQMFADNVQKADGDIFEAMEQFTRAGYKIPANLKGLITGTVTITDTKGNTKKDMPFSDYYRLREGKTDSKGKILTFEEIAAEFSKLVAAGGVYDARNP